MIGSNRNDPPSPDDPSSADHQAHTGASRPDLFGALGCLSALLFWIVAFSGLRGTVYAAMLLGTSIPAIVFGAVGAARDRIERATYLTASVVGIVELLIVCVGFQVA